MDSNSGLSRHNEEMRIVMVGKKGNGKSATGNTILGQQCFKSEFSAESMTIDCSKGKAVVDGQQVAVIDTPGLFDTSFDMDKATKAISQCISYASPGPHVFLVVIRLGRYTPEEKQTVQWIQDIFGQAADKYSMVLFTHGDLLEDKTIEDFLKDSSELQELVTRCNGQYHVFNNKLRDRSQVTELLQKIRSLTQKNGGSHYTNEMFQEAKREIEVVKMECLSFRKKEKRPIEQQELDRKLQEIYEKHKKMIEQLQAERARESKEREEERKREREEREAERKEIEEERTREREEREAERKRDEEEMKKMIEQLQAEKERERKEREEERKREREERERERMRQSEEREAKRKSEEEERERNIANMQKMLEKQLERELEEERERLRKRVQEQLEKKSCTIL